MKKTDPIPPKTLSTSQAAEFVGCSQEVIRSRVKRGHLTPAARIGRYMVFYLSDIHRIRGEYVPRK